MTSLDGTGDDDAFLDQLMELALRSEAEGKALPLADLLRGREHLRERAQRLLLIAADVAPLRASRPPHTERQLAGFTILGEAGRGSMGIVYRARQEQLGRIVALKVLSPALTLSSSARERFAVEARALGRVHHPSVVVVHDVVANDDLCAYAMEWIEGATLAQTIAKEGRLEVAEVARLGEAIARALAAVHEQGLVHRDVKPSNILLRPDRSPVLSDFSLVRDREQQLHTATGEFVGTAAFAAPEQLRGEHDRIGPWTDVYSLAATLCVSLTGRAPFAGTSTADVLRRIESGARAPLRRQNPKVPRDLETILAKAMDPEPSRRYASAGELADDLGRMLRLEPIRARAAGRALRLLRFVERSPQLALALAGLVVALVLGLGVSIYFTVTLRAAEQKARDEGAIQQEFAYFLRHVFRQGDAAGWGRADMTVLEALEKVADDIADEARASNRPESRYVIRMMVAETFVGVGRIEEAMQHLTAARELAHTVYGSDSEQAGAVAHLMGRVQRDLGRLDEAEQSLRDAVRIRRLVEPQNPLELAQSLSSLGIVLRHRNQFAAAEEHYRQALTLYRTHLGEENENVALVTSSIATLQQKQGRLADAERTKAQALEMLERFHKGEPHLDVAVARFALGGIQLQSGRVEVGEAAMRAALAMTRSVVGTQHRQFAEQCSRLGTALAATKPAEAESLHRESLAAYLELQNHNAACGEAVGLGELLLAGNRPAEAEPMLVAVLDRVGDSPARQGVLRLLGVTQTRLCRFESAESMLLQAWSLAENQGDSQKATALALAELYEIWQRMQPDPARDTTAADWRNKATR